MKGLAQSIRRSYGSAQKRYLAFCDLVGEAPVSAMELRLCRFVAYLAADKKAYLSAVRHLHIAEGAADLFMKSLPCLEYTLRGVKRCEEEAGVGKRERLPITPTILWKVQGVWEWDADKQDRSMLWAACCLDLFYFLRAGEFTVPSDREFNPEVHLTKEDITVDSPAALQVLRVHIKQFKTDPFKQGIHLFVEKTKASLCQVAAMLAYLVDRREVGGPLFVYQDGRYLTRQRLVEVRDALERVGMDQSAYCGHSFRIGAAMMTAKRGMEDIIIKTLG